MGMRRDGYPAMCIHGDKQQREREWVLGEFKSGGTTILVATDVAARGLHVDDVKFVINYDYPNNSEDYIHRIGRTGRKDNKGTAYTLFTPNNGAKARDLVEVLTEAKQVVNPKLLELAQCGGGFGGRSRYGGGGRGGRSYGGGRGGGRGRWQRSLSLGIFEFSCIQLPRTEFLVFGLRGSAENYPCYLDRDHFKKFCFPSQYCAFQ